MEKNSILDKLYMIVTIIECSELDEECASWLLADAKKYLEDITKEIENESKKQVNFSKKEVSFLARLNKNWQRDYEMMCLTMGTTQNLIEINEISKNIDKKIGNYANK